METAVKDISPVHGGDINDARLINTEKGNFFLKINDGPSSFGILESEVKGLQFLDSFEVIRTPEIHLLSIIDSTAFLLMEYIPSGNKSSEFWETFGERLAQLHQQSSPTFGLDHDNYIGSLPQRNGIQLTWVDFFIKERIRPQIDLAQGANRIDSNVIQDFETLFKKLNQLLPDEPPAAIHGDLWSGNFMVDNKNQPILIDPSVSFAHREMDLAMSRLFGGFPPLFYQAYHSVYPLHPGFDERVEIYQLYYLLVHVNHFGGGYLNSVKSILRKFV